jgi:hypothetical protein
MGQNNFYDALQKLAEGLQALATKLTHGQGQAAIDPILEAIKKKVSSLATNQEQAASPAALSALAKALGALPAKVTDNQAQAAVEPILAAIRSGMVDGSGRSAEAGKLTGKGIAEALAGIVSLVWTGLAFYSVWLLRAPLTGEIRGACESARQGNIAPLTRKPRQPGSCPDRGSTPP